MADELVRTTLADLESRAWAYFDATTHPTTGFVLDRSLSRKDGPLGRMSSIAAIGYALSLLPARVERGAWKRSRAAEQSARTLRAVLDLIPHHHGVCAHFVDWETGRHWERCEFSTLDTAILLNGCIVCAAYFGDNSAKFCAQLLDRVEWPSVVIEHPVSGKQILSYGVDPANGPDHPAALKGHGADRRSTENLMPYLLAAGAGRHAVDARLYYNVEAEFGVVAGRRILNPAHALFTSYYGLAWVNLEGLHDADGVDYHANAREAALANRTYCLEIASKDFATYAASYGGWWGLSAGDTPRGYDAKGPIGGDPDGMAFPTAALAALPWIQTELQADLLRWRESRAWEKVLGKFGLAPFSVDRKWVGSDIIAIDVGSLLLNLINHRDGLIRKLWMSHPVATSALERLQFSR